MRVLIFALSPPPFHGISTMVGHLLDGLREKGQGDLAKSNGGDSEAQNRIAYYHINPQISTELSEIGAWRPQKILRIFGYIFQAIAARFRHRLDTFYFTPHEAKRAAWYRDVCVLLLCRPFFKNTVLHWHCLGQAKFVEEQLSWPERMVSHWAVDGATLSICLSEFSRREAAYFKPRQTVLVPNGIPDPCPDFDQDVLPQRQKRAAQLAAVASGQAQSRVFYEVLFIAIRFTPKGLFDAMAAVTAANEELAGRSVSLRLRLTVAGQFDSDEERARFDEAARVLNATQFSGVADPLVNFVGWADPPKKSRLYREADCFILPSTYSSESFGLVLVEAMAHGCAIVTTRWQAIPEVLPPGYPHILAPHDIPGLTRALLACTREAAAEDLRGHFIAHYTRDRFITRMIGVLDSLSGSSPSGT